MGQAIGLGQGIESTLAVDVVFWVVSVVTILSAVAVVQSRDLFRAALYLIASFLGVAALFVLLRAEFLAAVQVLIYAGAISVLIIFAILMTRDVEVGSPFNRLRLPAALVVAGILAVMVFVALTAGWNVLDEAQGLGQGVQERVVAVFSDTVPWLARLLLRDFVLAFEVASLVLLAAIVGALVLIRER